MKGWMLLGMVSAGFFGCLVDIHGGDPRLQIKNSSSFIVRSTGIGDPQKPTFIHELNPALKPEKSSEVIELPAAGRLNLWIRISDSAKNWDTVLYRPHSIDLGEFQTIEVSGEQRGVLSTLP